jgi:hypothetical protein
MSAAIEVARARLDAIEREMLAGGEAVVEALRPARDAARAAWRRPSVPGWSRASSTPGFSSESPNGSR